MRYALHYIESTGEMNRPVKLALPQMDMDWFLQEIIGTGYRHLFDIIPVEDGTRFTAGDCDSGLIKMCIRDSVQAHRLEIRPVLPLRALALCMQRERCV